jgi:cytochrome c peroxidase
MIYDPPANPELPAPTPYVLTKPTGWPDIIIPPDNPMTVEGVALGRRLYYDPILSGDSTQACASCHAQDFAFTDNGLQFSEGIDGIKGGRNAPGVINVAWLPSLFWDGRAGSLEEQAMGPVPNPIEMHLAWKEAATRLKKHPIYPALFAAAFPGYEIDSTLVTKAIAQFERTLISGGSKYDSVKNLQGFLTDAQLRGHDIYFSEIGDCFHCHGTRLLTDNLFHNNGLDSVITDKGLGAITMNPNDDGKFKSPTMHNIMLTAPYMHDGRFATIEEVIDFYSEGVKFSSTIDPLMKNVGSGGIQLDSMQKADLIEFLKTFTDKGFVTNPEYSSPF